MAQPPSYERQKNFADDFGNETDHSALNAELDRASNSINDIRTNLALIQADDGKIRASSITTDSLDQEVLDYVQEKALAGANAVADAATAIAREAQQHAASAVQTASGAVDKSEEAVATAEAAQTQAQQAETRATQALSETAQIDSKVTAAVDEALHDAIIPGLTPETIAGALGYIPYDAETNSQDFATSAEVAHAISEIPEQVNTDWNAKEGPEQILNKPELSTVATSGSYNDLQDKPDLSEVALSGDYSDLKNIPSAIPSGFIGLWSGAADAIPDSWALCNGENGTPDLRDKFIIGAGNSHAVGATGGNASQAVNLSGNTGYTTLTVDQMPSHTHGMNYAGYGCSNGNKTMTPNTYGTASATGATGGNQAHAHSFYGSATVSILPPYYALCYIMKL
ncbi:hypothetical protein NB636_04790 [Oxalobacter aliiformigenes]|uniref:hypothetical protein n=1 Tax=Oxalobacter aliiformigenes TaxID=2946593 RepID=UPI0022AEEDF5|nr:hypothetical protein [Oxalobacter aliiformigenes]MCZ4064935.1 hypothetical protein [Oxalobacter aliiformigenes]WAW00165.1 hypothetical protein NB636_04790 [Oxalobacter aliiformigenes]